MMFASGKMMILCFASALLVACSTTAPSQSGFLSNHADLKPDKHGKSGLLWAEQSGFDWKKYRKVMLDPVLIYYHSQAGNRAIRPEKLNKFAGYFRETVVPANRALNAVTTAVAFVPIEVVDLHSAELARTETVTLLNDLCFLVPSALLGRQFQWRAIDDLHSEVTFENGEHAVRATLVFNESGDLTDFVSDDRGELQRDGV